MDVQKKPAPEKGVIKMPSIRKVSLQRQASNGSELQTEVRSAAAEIINIQRNVTFKMQELD